MMTAETLLEDLTYQGWDYEETLVAIDRLVAGGTEEGWTRPCTDVQVGRVIDHLQEVTR